MQIGLECFRDEQLRSMVASNLRYGNCEIQHKKDCIVYDTAEDHYLEEYLTVILDAFTTIRDIGIGGAEKRADYLKSFLSKWKLFSVSEEDIEVIMKGICSERYDEEPDLFDKKVTIIEFFYFDVMEQQCILRNYNWEEFCYNIKHVNRFHTQQVNFEQFKKLLENMIVDIPAGTLRLFRSRICDEYSYTTGYPAKEMGAPPIHAVSPGRTNSEGIQCLYLADDKETTFHEVKAKDHDHVSVGEFVQIEDLRIVDLSLFDNIGPFSSTDFDMTWFAINIEIIRKLGDEVAKPMRRFDHALDYVPTQYICDYIKYLGYDGIKFKSTLREIGTNYAIFDEKKFNCSRVQVIQIGDIEYQWNEIESEV